MAGLNQGEQHPYLESLSKDQSIDSLIKLFKDNDHQFQRDDIASILAIPFKAQSIPLDIRDDLIYYLKINQQHFFQLGLLAECQDNHKYILADDFVWKLFSQDDFFIVRDTLDREDVEMHKKAINSGIIEAFHNIFTLRDLNDITYTQFMAFFHFTWPYNSEISSILVEKKSLIFLLRLLDHQNNDILNESINALVNIMYGGTIGLDETQIHPYYENLIQVGGIEKIYSLFKRNMSSQSKDSSAKCLGIAFKAQKIDDETMRKEIIIHLKSILEDDAGEIDEEVELALRCLAQNPDNCVEIEKEKSVLDEYKNGENKDDDNHYEKDDDEEDDDDKDEDEDDF
ncbi:MAG: hypothetical protein EZS28_016237 [Streblomastix strix]|uniref:Uncharacterized protein n=1 Tax=Streblomastix strix TaxID=222440 RepID=A0A5J4VZZ6_9EUKA|nr:MAG: hypothetical protein EZS28_016237 [Streblomastix strix]